MRNTLFGFILGIGCMVLMFAFMSNFADSTNTATLKSEKFSSDSLNALPQKIETPQLKTAYDFAGESLDMSNTDVRERLERELLRNTYFHSNTLLILKRSRRYFPLIEQILAEAGLPDDLKYVAVTESDLENVTSPAGARGLWQFMPAVGRQYGLEVNSEVDERYHVEKSTRAACKHLKNYYKKFESWQFVAAAYNMGEGNMRKFLREQGAERYEDFNINQETMRYLFRIVAMKSIMEDPNAFGFYLEDEDYYQPETDYEEVDITKSVANLAAFAKSKGTSYRGLKRMNPWLIDKKLTVSKKRYVFKIPN